MPLPGFTIKRGVSRTVILTRRWAIKVPSFRRSVTGGGLGSRLRSFAWGVAANHQELDWRGQPGFCPIKASWLGIVQIYPRCDEVDHKPTKKEFRAITGMGFPSDYKRENVGLLDGQLVWVDYGD